LTETLLSSAQITIESDEAITSLGIEKLIDDVDNLDPTRAFKDESVLDIWRKTLDAEKISLVVDRKIKTSSSGLAENLDNSDIDAWLDSLKIDPDAEIVYDFRTFGPTRYLWSYFPIDDTRGLFIATIWEIGQYGNERLSLSYLLNQVGQESGIEYVMLQNEAGIIFASKKIAIMPKLSDDPFLVAAMKSDTTSNRILTFQDREVLETVKTFKSHSFEGLFRVGLSLYGYRQIAGGVRRQVWLVVAALIIIGMLAFGIVSGFQNYESVKNGLEKARIVSQGLLDSIPGPVVAVDSQMRITDINAMAKNTLGISRTAAGNDDYLKAFPDDPFRFGQVIATKRSANFEKSLGENNRQYYITTTPLIGSNGDSIGAITIAQDITETRKFEGMAESRRRLSELGALAASMAHEIRNPLNAIGITIQRMRNEIKPAGSEQDYYQFIDGLRSEIKRLNDIIEKFLAVARSVRPEISAIDIKGLISSVVELFDNQAKQQNIKLTWNAPSDISIEGDKAGLTQALVNVVKNSIEAVGKTGEIDIKAVVDGRKVRISVTDNGPGIADSSLAVKPFYTTKKDGTGLGLATASKIMADHGGELQINSNPGKGCRVDLILLKDKVIG
jgi:signal transduction histidine kinase